MGQRRGEYALHEFGTVEFGKGASTLVHSATFSGFGESRTDNQIQVYAHTTSDSQGLALFDGVSLSYQNSSIDVEAKGSFIPFVEKVVNATYGSESFGIFNPDSGIGVGVTFSSTGEAVLDFLLLDGYEFHIAGLSTSNILSSVQANTYTHSTAASVFSTEASSLLAASTHIQGASSVSSAIQALSQSNGYVLGSSTGIFRNQRILNTDLTATGLSSVFGRSQQVILSRLLAQGLSNVQASSLTIMLSSLLNQGHSSFDGFSDYTAYVEAILNSQGNAYSQFQGVQVIHGNFTSTNGSFAEWFRGRNTMPYLPESVYSFIRPEEIRTVEWKL